MTDTTGAPKGVRHAVVGLLDKGVNLSMSNMRDTILTMRLANYTTHQWLEGNVFPALGGTVDMNQQLVNSLLQSMRGEKRWRDLAKETGKRVVSGVRFSRLVSTYGKELFGSARFDGETILTEDEFFKLSYLPPKPGVPEQDFALFHSGGGIPYGDRIFRMLPEANFFDRFLERGIGVYAMELKGDRYTLNYSGLTLERLIDSIERMSSVAAGHGNGRKMVLEGYCGHGMQTLAYVAAKPKDAQDKFKAITTFVAPIDGTECTMIAELTRLMPAAWVDLNLAMWKVLGGYVPGDNLRSGLDLALRTTFHKTPFGHWLAGFTQFEYAKVKSMSDLTPAQRKDLAGTYWISADNARRFPIPVDLVRYATNLFSQGVAKNGDIPFTYHGKSLSLRDIAEQTNLPMVGFYGGRDVMVPDRTAFVLMGVLGSRYQHVVHPSAGHISYVLSPRLWDTKNPKGLSPNPIDVLIRM